MFTEPLPNTVYTAHDYVTAGLDPHAHYPSELDGRFAGSAKGDVYNKDTIHQQFLRRTAFMRDLGLPIWIGEFGPLYNGTPQQAEERYQLLQDQLDIYRDYQASWALWLYKDIGLQGVVFAAADSPYMALLTDFLAKKQRLGADSWVGPTNTSAKSSARSSRCSLASSQTSTPIRGAHKSGPRGCCVTFSSPKH
jgi:endoglucanase